MLETSRPLLEKPTAFFEASWQEVCHETELVGESTTKKAHLGAMWKSFGKAALVATLSLQKKVTMRSAMEHKGPRRSVHLGRPYPDAWWF